MTDAIGTTASITLLTAIPGSGKSLRIVQWICEAIARGEHVFVSNLDGLNVEGFTPWDDPTKWQQLPAGAVLVVDEAQKFFRSRRSGEPPAYITAMETIRHEGVRLILATQQPNYLDSHLRGLVGLHEHLKRVEGKDQSTIFRSDEVMEDVRSKNMAQKYDWEVWDFPKQYYGCYKSAQVHTVQPVESSKWKRWKRIFMVMGAAVVLGLALTVARCSSAGESVAPALGPQLAAGTAQALPASRGGEAEPMSTEQYLQRMVPRIPEAFYSAPIFDDRAVQSEPAFFCMASGEGEGQASSCSCMTEQGTRYAVERKMCLDIARHGTPYNPFKAPTEPQAPAAAEAEPEAAPNAVAGVRSDPGDVGTPAGGEVWGRSPETLRATR